MAENRNCICGEADWGRHERIEEAKCDHRRMVFSTAVGEPVFYSCHSCGHQGSMTQEEYGNGDAARRLSPRVVPSPP